MKRLALATLLVATTAHSQPAAQANSARDTIIAQEQHLGESIQILGDMAIGQDRETVVAIMNTIALFMANLNPVIELATMVPDIRDQQDVVRIAIQLVQDVNRAQQSADMSLKTMNIALTLIKGQAVLAESTKARDTIIAIRDQLRSIQALTPPSK